MAMEMEMDTHDDATVRRTASDSRIPGLADRCTRATATTHTSTRYRARAPRGAHSFDQQPANDERHTTAAAAPRERFSHFFFVFCFFSPPPSLINFQFTLAAASRYIFTQSPSASLPVQILYNENYQLIFKTWQVDSLNKFSCENWK